MKIDPRLKGQYPKVDRAVPLAGVGGRIKGWKLTIPGGRPLATPAVVGGRVFLGGGFGGYEFYALDAATGAVAWQYQTTDDGPTAAVVDEGYVAFNTESCELEVLTVEGRPVWKHWLGDPLMSMPAIHRGRVYMAYPNSRGDHQHYLACFDLATGRELWKRPITGDIITAPVIAEGRIYLATLDGTLYCFDETGGDPLWHEPKDATSSPAVRNGQCYFSRRRETSGSAGQSSTQQMEHVAGRGPGDMADTWTYHETSRAADYLDHAKRARRSPRYAAGGHADAGVGFGAHKGSAKMHQAMKNLGVGHVSGVWAYQGSKPFLSRGRLYSGLGDTLHCLDPETKTEFWKRAVHQTPQGEELLDSVLTPAALVNGKAFLGTTFGQVFCLCADSGDVLWHVDLGEPVFFQPAVARGRVYVPTGAGSLYCLETGDPADDGWLMWGGAAAHNGLPD